ncbi:hypothetical protein FOA52_016270 [Chlamydomonas sp. UWO 241]|nr:hypothetical protein FOA52_016270 [Chlamydomonas sp. UWO 241]
MASGVAPRQQHRRIAPVQAGARSSGVTTAAPAVPPPANPLIMAAVEALFGFKPFFELAAKNARGMIIKRAESLGLDWAGAMADMQTQDWDARLKAVESPGVSTPDYYEKPFHAYARGNLCWEAALEVSMAAKSVHAMTMDPEGKQLDAEGDQKLRASYSAEMRSHMAALGVDPGVVRDVLDMGAASGLSSLEILRAFPGASVTGVDLSPHFLAVGRYEQEKRNAAAAASAAPSERLTLVHAAAESTGLPDASVDLVSVCLVCHELPQRATRALMAEAMRVLRPGGVLSIMEMDPTTPAFRRMLGNPFALTAFKSTEPWLTAVADAAGALVVTPAEVRAAATHSKPGTAPGPDGIPVDVWRKLGEPAFELLAAVFTAVGATGGTPPGFLDGVVASIYKAKNAADAANYRPLTMLGSDYRILAKVLATRWTPLLSAVVGPEQTAFLAGRRISDNICLTQMLPGLLAANAAEGVGPTGAALALLDFRKAYDTIDRGFLIAVMEAVGVGDGVLAWTRTILTHTYASAEVNGFISAPRKYAAGVRQGCPAAPALFLFLGHALACFLRTCPAVGVEVVPGCRVTCPQYADDCMPLLRSCAPADVAALVETMAVFGRATGLVLNIGKCILPLGSAGEGLLAGAEVAGLRVLDAGVSLGVPVSAGLLPPEGVTGALGPVARITGRVQTAELWGAEAPLWANPLLQLELPAAQRSVQWREPTGDAAGHALFSPTDAARWLVDGLARVRDALPGMRTVTDLCVLWAWLAAVDMVFAGLRGLEAAVPTLWRMPLLNARKEPIWRLWEYVALDMQACMTDAGFGAPLQSNNSPRHKTVVAVKPVA